MPIDLGIFAGIANDIERPLLVTNDPLYLLDRTGAVIATITRGWSSTRLSDGRRRFSIVPNSEVTATQLATYPALGYEGAKWGNPGAGGLDYAVEPGDSEWRLTLNRISDWTLPVDEDERLYGVADDYADAVAA